MVQSVIPVVLQHCCPWSHHIWRWRCHLWRCRCSCHISSAAVGWAWRQYEPRDTDTVHDTTQSLRQAEEKVSAWEVCFHLCVMCEISFSPFGTLIWGQYSKSKSVDLGADPDFSVKTTNVMNCAPMPEVLALCVSQYYLVFGWCDFDELCKLHPKGVWCLYHGNPLWLKDVHIHLKEKPGQGRMQEHAQECRNSCMSWYIHLELWHQPPRLQVQRVLVETQSPVHHLLVMELKLNVTAGRNMDLCLKGLHILGISPVKQKYFSLYGAVELNWGF